MDSKRIRRRDFLKSWGVGAVALSWPQWTTAAIVPAQTTKPEPTSPPKSARHRTTVLEDMANWVAELRYDDLPPEAIKRAKRVLLDTVGCALGAVNAAPVRIARDTVIMAGGHAQATVMGMGSKVSCDQAAFLNGMAIRYLDYNDYAALGSPHHCSMNVAPALAVAEMRNLTGKDVLLGLVTGYEVQLRMRDATEGGSTAGWDTGSITVAYSSAALAAKLMGLDASKIANAVAIAAAHANTLQEVRVAAVSSGGEMTPSKGTAEPIGIKNGTFAALLASNGLTYPLTILEGKSGYAKMVTKQLQEDILRQRAGDFEIMKSCIKLWPCVVTGQAPIAAALQIRRQSALPENIESISIGLSDFAYKQQQDLLGEIKVREHADHSVPYIVSRALLDGAVKVDDFEPARFRDPRALEMMKKVSFYSESSLSSAELGANMEVKLRNGGVLKAEFPQPPGSLRNPADDESVMRKFLTLSENILGKQRAQQAAEVILSVEKMTDLGELVKAISGAKAG